MVLLVGHVLVIVSLFLAAGVLDDANEILEDDLFLWFLVQGRQNLFRVVREPDRPLLQAFFTVSFGDFEHEHGMRLSTTTTTTTTTSIGGN